MVNDIEDMILNIEHKVTYQWRDWFYGDVPDDVDVPGLGIVNVEKTGNPFDGDPYIILSAQTPDGNVRYFKKTFCDSSFGVDNYGPFYEVYPTTRTVTEFK